MSALRRLRDHEDGQTLPLLAAGLVVVLLAFAAFVVDIGHGFLVQRKLQASVDAAALAGAEQLPADSAALVAGQLYGPTGRENGVDGAATPEITTSCLKADTTCSATDHDRISITASATVETTFAKVLGINSFTVRASSTAARTTSSKPLDIALVLDRTGSMSGQLGNLRNGVNTFLDDLDPSKDHVALLVLPPLPANGSACSPYNATVVKNDWYPLGSEGSYVVDHLTSNFSQLLSDVNCLQAGGPTSYKEALIAAQDELTANGRAGVEKVIVFETDGAANTVPDDDYAQPAGFTDGGHIVTGAPGSPQALADIQRPCGSAVDYAASLNGSATVYTVGYELSGDNTCYQAPHQTTGSDPVGYKQLYETDTNAGPALAAMASDTGGQYFPQENGAQLDQTFAAVASEFSAPQLVSDSS